MEDRNQPCRGNGNQPATVCYWNRHLHSRSGQRATGSKVSTSVRASYRRAFATDNLRGQVRSRWSLGARQSVSLGPIVDRGTRLCLSSLFSSILLSVSSHY